MEYFRNIFKNQFEKIKFSQKSSNIWSPPVGRKRVRFLKKLQKTKGKYLRFLFVKKKIWFVNFSRSYGYFYQKNHEKCRNFPISKISIFSDTFPFYGERGEIFQFLRAMGSTRYNLLSFDVLFIKIGPARAENSWRQTQKKKKTHHDKINTFSASHRS